MFSLLHEDLERARVDELNRRIAATAASGGPARRRSRSWRAAVGAALVRAGERMAAAPADRRGRIA